MEGQTPVIGIKRVDHVSFATWSVDESLKWFEAIMGLKVAHRWRAEREGFADALLDMPNNQMQFELIEPIGEESFVTKFLKSRGAGFHHITVEVDDVRAAGSWLQTHGIEPFQGIHESGGWLQTYIHPTSGGGVLWQLFETLPAPGSGPS